MELGYEQVELLLLERNQPKPIVAADDSTWQSNQSKLEIDLNKIPFVKDINQENDKNSDCC